MWYGRTAFSYYAKDITETMKEKNKLKDLSTSLEKIINHIPAGISVFVADERDNIIRIAANPSFGNIIERPSDELIGKKYNDVMKYLHPDDRKSSQKNINDLFNGKISFSREIYRVKSEETGKYKWVQRESSLLESEGRKEVYCTYTDVTTRQQEDARFRDTFQSLLAESMDSICAFQINLTKKKCAILKGDIEYLRKMIKYNTPDNLINTAADLIVDEENQIKFRKEFSSARLLKSFEHGINNLTDTFMCKDKKGNIIWAKIVTNMILNPETSDVHAIINAVDITRTKRAEGIFDILTNQEYDFVALLHLNNQRIEFLNLSDKLLTKYIEKFGEEGAFFDYEIARKMSLGWIDDQDKDMYRKMSSTDIIKRELDEHGKYELSLRGHYTDKPGSMICRKLQHYYLDDQKDIVIIVQSDVTRTYLQQQREMELIKEKAKKVTDIMDSISGGIAVLNMSDENHLRIEYANLQLYRILGYETTTGNGIENHNISEYFEDGFMGVYPDDIERVRKTFRKNFKSDSFVVDNYRMLGGDGKYRWLKLQANLREINQDYRVFYATYTDVGEEVRLSKKIQKQRKKEQELMKQALAANEEKSRFLSQMSHDIRTPLNGIIGMTSIAFMQDNSPKTKDCLEKIDISSRFLLGLINDILDMSKIESGEVGLHPEPYPFDELVFYINSIFEPLSQNKRQKLEIKCGEKTHFMPVIDKLRLNQIIFNLISNAVKYTPDCGNIWFMVEEEKTEKNTIKLLIKVADNGIGMSEEFQKVLFDPFTQEDRSRMLGTVNNSTGLGLSIVKQLLDIMNGSIRVESREGEGSTFYVELEVPCVPDKFVNIKENSEPEDAKGALKGKKLLIVEDNEINQEITKTILESAGMYIDIADDGRKGVDMFEASAINAYDGILMDIRMPIMDGFEATKCIRNMTREDAAGIPIIAMTADVYGSDVKRCFDVGMNSHIGKPFEPDRIFDLLAQVLA